jgi:hypothetical protein
MIPPKISWWDYEDKEFGRLPTPSRAVVLESGNNPDCSCSEHHPPRSQLFTEGDHVHTCPKCGRSIQFTG